MNALYRKASLGQADLDARSVPVVIATDAPYQRNGYIEVLDMSRVDLSRGDLPLIESHNANQLNIGIVRNVRVDGNKLRGLAVFGQSARASEILADVSAGIVTGVSVGYMTDEGAPLTINGQAVRKFGFQPFEVSAVAVPADTAAGFFRRHTLSLPQKQTQETPMKTTELPPVAEIRNHAAEISAIAAVMPGGAELAIRSIQAGHTVEQFQVEAIRAMSNKPLATAGCAEIQTITRESGSMKVLRSADDFRAHYAMRPQSSEAPGLTDFIRGIARMKTTPAAARALSVGVDSTGGYAVPSLVMPEILAALVPVSSLLQAGVGIIPLDEGAKNYSFAAVDALPTPGWRNENDDVVESAPTFKNLIVTPHSLAFMVKISRELLADATNIDSALREVIAQAFAKEIDRVGLRGSGITPVPRGLLNTVGVNAVTSGANGAALASYGNLFSGVQALLGADAPMPNAAIMSPRSLVKLGALADTTGQPLQVPSMLQNLKFLGTSQVPDNLTVGTSSDCSEIYIGDFTKMALAMRENLSIQVLEEAFANKGQIAFMCHVRMDTAVLYPKAFALVTGVR